MKEMKNSIFYISQNIKQLNQPNIQIRNSKIISPKVLVLARWYNMENTPRDNVPKMR